MSTETLTIAPSHADWAQMTNDETFVSVSGVTQTQGRVGNRWQLSLTFDNLSGADRRTVMGHAMQLRGMQNRLRVYLSTLGYRVGGVGGGTPILSGTHLAGAQFLSGTGAPLSFLNWVKVGDFLRIGNELKMIVQHSGTDGSGAWTTYIWPELHKTYPASTAVDIVTPYGDFYLTSPMSFSIAPGPTDWISGAVVMSLEEDVLA